MSDNQHETLVRLYEEVKETFGAPPQVPPERARQLLEMGGVAPTLPEPGWEKPFYSFVDGTRRKELVLQNRAGTFYVEAYSVAV